MVIFTPSTTYFYSPVNIEQRNGLWYAVVMVPKDLRSTLGIKFIQSLKTHSKQEAQIRALPLISRWKAEIKKTRGNPTAVIDEALMWKREIAKSVDGDGESDHGTTAPLIDALVERAETIAATQGDAKAEEFYGTAMGTMTPLKPLYDEWKGQLDLAPKTMDQMGRDAEKLVTHFVTLEKISPRGVKAWVDSLALEGHTHSSIERILKACKSLWKYLRRTSVVELDAIDPFQGIMSLISERVEKNKQGRVALSPEDVTKLYQGALDNKDQPLADIIALGAYTGARISDLSHLKVTDVTDVQSLLVRTAKTKAGIREIPIHPSIAGLVERLKTNATSEYLIPSDAANQYGNRADALGKRFGRLKDSMGFAKGSEVFHSIRKTLITLMDNAGVPEGVAADIVGHEKQTMTYGLYSMGSVLDKKREALAKAVYPAPLVNLA